MAATTSFYPQQCPPTSEPTVIEDDGDSDPEFLPDAADVEHNRQFLELLSRPIAKRKLPIEEEEASKRMRSC
jgi:hypothetical protein